MVFFICIIGALKGEMVTEKLLKDIMAKMFPNLIDTINTQILKSQKRNPLAQEYWWLHIYCQKQCKWEACVATSLKYWKEKKCQHRILYLVKSSFKNKGHFFKLERDGILLSHKKNEIMSFVAAWVKLDIIMLSKLSQKEKKKYHMISLIYEI